jgi:hypothetical protein
LAARISLARSEGIARVADWIDDAIDDRFGLDDGGIESGY